jgi:hypothetical protein
MNLLPNQKVCFCARNSTGNFAVSPQGGRSSTPESTTSLRGAKATKQSILLRAARWIASLALATTSKTDEQWLFEN